ncbi:30S ribosome-binding factor RbfA [Scrofimicrobium sp. R131]|uniref:Ribosome-binding factor A n=1 Tax=Scrofimicrobium appendicitidis TaxID=3079930 RepID=A0AAU7V5S5_9ACTO
MADESRVRRVQENIKMTVARTLERRVKDPRLGFITITEVKATRDLQHATIFYTVLGDEKAARDTRKALESAKGLIRSEVGKALGLRLTPTISFEADRLPDEAASIEEALRAARERDAEIARHSADKEYVAGEDPYREEPVESDDDE